MHGPKGGTLRKHIINYMILFIVSLVMVNNIG